MPQAEKDETAVMAELALQDLLDPVEGQEGPVPLERADVKVQRVGMVALAQTGVLALQDLPDDLVLRDLVVLQDQKATVDRAE